MEIFEIQGVETNCTNGVRQSEQVAELWKSPTRAWWIWCQGSQCGSSKSDWLIQTSDSLKSGWKVDRTWVEMKQGQYMIFRWAQANHIPACPFCALCKCCFSPICLEPAHKVSLQCGEMFWDSEEFLILLILLRLNAPLVSRIQTALYLSAFCKLAIACLGACLMYSQYIQ